MVCLDLRGDSKLGKLLANKLVSILAAIVQLIFWLMILLNFIIQPDYVNERLQNTSTSGIAFNIIFNLIIVIFSGLLLFGLFKDRVGFLKSYLIFNVVFIVVCVLSFFVSLFTSPAEVGIGGFIGIILIFMLNILFYFIIRNYYLAFTSKQTDRNPA